jgi:transcription factor WhiB
MRSAYDLDPTSADPHAWRLNAACGPATADWFWPLTTSRLSLHAEHTKAALALCAVCPVKAECYAHEQTQPVEHTHIAAGKVWAK